MRQWRIYQNRHGAWIAESDGGYCIWALILDDLKASLGIGGAT